ncbi:MAG TPA: 2-oxoglutarate dehydrogenase complex dihydrolipoyllysine-residue succinyltransferase [Candidatus Binatia bacterium]|nr:2-oxoglutarate dehydrogenase complex dihydrolipoyllysine-residue succinyltransferase [Candidatus Binatia bacterium]
MAVELRVPEVGESIKEVQIGAWLKGEGDRVERDEAVVEIESDKATLELPAPVSGTIEKLLKKKGDVVKIGELIATMAEGAGGNGAKPAKGTPKAAASAARAVVAPAAGAASAAPAPAAPTPKAGAAPAAKAAPKGTPAPSATPMPAPPSAAPPRMPSADRLMGQHGIAPADVPASGPGGRVLKEDELEHMARKPEPGRTRTEPAAGAAGTGAAVAGAGEAGVGEPSATEEAVPMSPLRLRVAERLKEAQNTAALLTTFNEIDMSGVVALREELQQPFQERYGVKLGFMSFFVKAAIDALMRFPQVNAEIREKEIIYKNYYDIGIAVGGGRGLVVPVLRGADRLSFAEIEIAIADFAQRARDNKLSLDELKGGTFTISNGGVYGSLLSTPIVNPPQSGILGLHAIHKRPVAIDDEIVIRPMMYVALTYDHRIIDGRESVTFVKHVKELIERPTRMLLGL